MLGFLYYFIVMVRLYVCEEFLGKGGFINSVYRCDLLRCRVRFLLLTSLGKIDIGFWVLSFIKDKVNRV